MSTMFAEARDCNINGVFNNIGGNYNNYNVATLNQYVRQEKAIEELLSANFNDERYFEIRHTQNKRRTTTGTCTWLIDDTEFIRWRDDRASEEPILYVQGPPGSGKSTLCSQAIDTIMNSPGQPLVAFHFCDYAQQFKELEILSMLAWQLFERHFNSFNTPPLLPDPIASAARFQMKSPQLLRKIIRHIASQPLSHPTYFLLDGLDEELDGLVSSRRWDDSICPVLDFLVGLAKDFPQNVRLWVTSQPRTEVRNRLSRSESTERNHVEIDLTPHARRDIELYLSLEAPRIKGPDESDLKRMHDALNKAAEASFIWARLMLEEIQRKRSSWNAIQQVIREGFPQNLMEYYERMFNRFPEDLRSLASTVFSLIVYAKRPLRFCELREAVWALYSKDKRVLDPRDKPYEEGLIEVFQSFVERVPSSSEDSIPQSQDLYICRLIHSTLKDFLLKRRFVDDPSVVENATGVCVCPVLPAKACLDYLVQLRFSTLLERKGDAWVDALETPVLESRFIIYSAKYWDKHLNDIDELPEWQAALLPSVFKLLKSPNFWTVVQVQSIYLQSQFATFASAGDNIIIPSSNLRRSFPWSLTQTEEGFELWQQYRAFLRNWMHLLSCGTGDLQRIWTGALGQQHFLHGWESSLVCFSIAKGHEGSTQCMFFTDLVSSSGDVAYTLHICPKGDAESLSLRKAVIEHSTLRCEIQTWRLPSGASPVLEKRQTLPVEANTLDLHLYITDTNNPYASSNRAPLAAFSANGDVLRIGSRIFIKEVGIFRPLLGIRGESDRKEHYTEECSLHGRYLALAARTRISKKEVDSRLDDLQKDSDDEDEHGLIVVESDEDDEDDSRMVEAQRCHCLGYLNVVGDDTDCPDVGDGVGEIPVVGSDVDSDSTDEDEDGDDDDDDGISEGSSVCAEGEVFEDDDEHPWAHFPHAAYSDDEEGQGNEDSPSSSPMLSPSVESLLSGDFKAPLGAEKPSKVDRESDGDDSDDDDWVGLSQRLSGKKPSLSKPQSTISIFDTRCDIFESRPRLILQKKFSRKRKIYASPPVFHPTEPLLVWPLGDNEILFVDYKKEKTFTLRLRPSTDFTCHISVQCAFSRCGMNMHIAALEGRNTEHVRQCSSSATPGNPKNQAQSLPPVALAMLVSTYRLSSTKSTRSPPVLIHRVRIDLKKAKGIDTKNLPYNLTWTDEYLYVTESCTVLQVWRVPLFRHTENSSGTVQGTEATEEDMKIDDMQPVLAPEKLVFLPQTCVHRSVRFFAPSTASLQPGTAHSSKESSDNTDDEGDNGPHEASPSPGRIVVGYEAALVPLPAKGESVKGKLAFELIGNKLFFERPLVCYLNQDEDLGRWVDSNARTTISQYRGVGKLDRVEGMEKFNPDDDCELEPYFY